MAHPDSDSTLLQLATELGTALMARRWQVATAESCTGGGIAEAITAIPGSSAWFGYGLVTYANAAKQSLLGVSADSLAEQGAVSEVVVTEMVQGALKVSGADLAVAVSGVAGPGGGSREKPVGTVWLAWGQGSTIEARCFQFDGDRAAVRQQAVVTGLHGLLARCR